MCRIKIFTGHFGSGKTEVSINYALKLAAQGKKTAIVDLDIVNPYFCTRELKKELECAGVRVIASNPELVNAELMVISSEVMAIFNDKSYEVVMDVGGDDIGAIVLGQFNRYLKAEAYEMYFVINNNRPLTSDLISTEEYMQRVEKSSRLKISKLISNTNLSYETNVNDILKGDRLTVLLAEKLKIPYSYTVCRRDFVNRIEGKVHGEIFPIDIYMKVDW